MAGEVRNFAVVFVPDVSDLLIMFSEVDASVASSPALSISGTFVRSSSRVFRYFL